MQKDRASQESKETGQAEETLPVIVPDTQDNPDTEEQAIIEEEKPDDSRESGDQEESSAGDEYTTGEQEAPRDTGDEEESSIPEVLPVLPLKDTVVYPLSVQSLGVGQERSIRLIDDVMRSNRMVVLVAQKSSDIEQAGPKDIFKIGTVSRVVRMIRMPDGNVQLVVQGLERVAIGEFTQEKPYLVARVTVMPDVQEEDNETEAIKRNVINYFQRLVALVQYMPEGVAAAALNLEEARQVVYVIATFVQMELEQRQKLLELDSVRAKLIELSSYLTHELEILELGKKIQTSAQEEMTKVQREYLLREQLKAIQRELGEENEEQATVNELRQKIDEARMPEEALKEANRELSRLEKLPTISPEYSIIRTYLELLTSLPWSKSTGEEIDVPRARQVLDQDHYDLEKIKDRILEYLAVRRLKEERLAEHAQHDAEVAAEETSTAGNGRRLTQPLQSAEARRQINREPILCFVGPPGVGKTSLGQSIARALGRKFARMSLGGLHDEAELRGHRRTYIGAMPGRIIQAIKRTGTRNPVFILDEIDKVGQDWRGDPSSALLEALDPAQNRTFRDHYLDVDFDLSDVMFITTANQLETIPEPLRDRMEIIQLSGYTEHEKLRIAQAYLVPRQRQANGLRPEEITFTDEALLKIARDYTREAGVRNLERRIGAICRKVAVQITYHEVEQIKVRPGRVLEYLKHEPFVSELHERLSIPGIATGLAVTATGGDILYIEVTRMQCKGNLTLTGHLGDVMRERAQIAYSYVRAKAPELGVDPDLFANMDVHVHVPAGAIPKDGPSAGVAMVSAMTSLLTSRPVLHDVGMTGEITLRGRVLPVGGVKMKVLAAHRAGLTTVILPRRNEHDLDELPEEVRQTLPFIPVEMIQEVLSTALQPVEEPVSP